MKFNNVRIYNLKSGFELPPATELEELMFEYAYTDIRPEQSATQGFISPFGRRNSNLLHQVGDNVLFAVRKEEKIVPPAAVRAALEKKELAYFEEHNESMPKKLKKEIKEEIENSMIRTAFTKHSDTYAYFDRNNNRVIIGATSANLAEDVTALLRSALGSFPSIPWNHEVQTAEHLSQWLRSGELPHGFEFGGETKLDSTGDDGGSIVVRKQDIQNDQIISLLETNDCTKIELLLTDHATFSVDTDLAIKRIQFADVVINNAIDDSSQDYAEQIDSNFVLWSGEINHIIEKLNNAFGVGLEAVPAK